MNIQNTQWSEDITFDEMEILYAEQSLAGATPSVAELIARYPQWANQILEMALDFKEQQNARIAQQNTSQVVPSFPQELQTQIENRLAASRQPARTLNDARKSLNWTPEDLAQKLNLPTRVVVNLSRGLIQDWPRRLEWKLSAILMRPMDHIGGLLRNSVMTPAKNFSAEGPIGAPNVQSQSFRAALEDCERAHELTFEQREEWLSELDI